MADTPHIEFDHLIAGEDLQEVKANESFDKIDGLIMGAVLDRNLNTPPASPSDGDRYIVAALQWTMVTIVPGTKTITVSGNHAARVAVSDIFEIRGNTGGNNGLYTVVSATDNLGNTDIVVNETPATETADGNAYHVGGLWNDGLTHVEDYIALYYTGWRFVPPGDGFAVKVVDELTWVSWEESLSQWIIGIPIPVVTDATRPAAGLAGRLVHNSDHPSTPKILQIDIGTEWKASDGSAI